MEFKAHGTSKISGITTYNDTKQRDIDSRYNYDAPEINYGSYTPEIDAIDYSDYNNYGTGSVSVSSSSVSSVSALATSSGIVNTPSFSFGGGGISLAYDLNNVASNAEAFGTTLAKGIQSLCSNFATGIQNTASSIAEGFNTAVNKMADGAAAVGDWVSNKFSVAGDWVSNAWEKTGAFVSDAIFGIGNWFSDAGDWLSNKFSAAGDWVSNAWEKTGAFVSDTISGIGNWFSDVGEWFVTEWDWGRVGASVANAALSVVKGLVSLVEAIGDLALLIIGAVGTIGTGIYDIIHGIATGDWSWSATSGMWKNAFVPAVAYDWTSALDQAIGVRQYLDQWAYEPFKSDGLGCTICSGIGYVAGIIVISIFTFGTGGVAIGATASIGSVNVSAGAVGITAGLAGIGKYTQQTWTDQINENLNQQIVEEIQNVEITEEMYYTKLSELVLLDSTKEYTQQDVVNAIYNDLYASKIAEVSDWNTNWDKTQAAANTMTGEQIAMGAGIGIAKGAYEGFQYYTAVSRIGNFQSFAGMIKNIGSGSYVKGFTSLIKNFQVKQAVIPLAKKAVVDTFKDKGFYIQSGTMLYNDIKTGIQTGEWDILKMGAEVVEAYGNNFLGNLAGNYFQSGISASINKIYKKPELKVANEHTTAYKQKQILEFYNSQHPDNTFDSFEALEVACPDAVETIAIDEYRLRVLEENASWSTDKEYKEKHALDIAKGDYDDTYGRGAFDKLSSDAQKDLIAKVSIDVSSPEYQKLYNANIEHYLKVADDTVDRIHELYNNGSIKPEYSVADVLTMIEDDVPQTTYLTDSYVSEYYSKFNVSSDGKVEVVAFQNGNGVNFSTPKLCDGNLGREEGMFVMPKVEADRIISECCDPSTGKIDSKKLTELLGGVTMSDEVIVVSRTINVSDLSMPVGALDGAFVGEWKPGGMTTGGIIEGLVPQTSVFDSSVSITTYGNNKLSDYFGRFLKLDWSD